MLWITDPLRRRLHQLSLLQRLLVVEGAAFVVVVGGTLLVANIFADALRDRIEQGGLVSAESFAAETDELLAHGLHELRLAAEFLDAPAPGGMSTIDLMVLGSDLFTAGAAVTDGSMRVIDSDHTHASLRGLDLAPFIADASEGQDGARGWGMIPREGDRPVVALAIPRRVGDVSSGYLVGLIDPVNSSLTSVLRRAQRMGDTMHGDLVNEHAIAIVSTEPAHVLVSSDHPAYYREVLDAGFPSGIREVAHDDQGEGVDLEEGGENHVMGFSRLETFPWVFAVGGTVSETFALIGRLWTAVYGAVALVVTVAVGLTVMGTDRLLQPVRDLRESAHRVADGNLDTPMETSAGGEIGELAESIERMRESLNARGAELDRRVRERTKELERRTQELAVSAAYRQKLLAKVLSAQEDERQRIARELHDETGQALIGMMMGLDSIARSSPDRWEHTIEQVAGLRTLSEEALDNLRQMIFTLRPSQLDHLGLLSAIESYADRVVRSTGISVEIDSSLGDERLPSNTEVAVFRIVQEALNNVVRHSGATAAHVQIGRESRQLSVEVSDDGRGFVKHESNGLNGVGIEGMMERADLLGGQLEVSSTPGAGTIVRLKVEDDPDYETRAGD